MNCRAWRVLSTCTLALIVVGCDPMTQSTTTAAEQLQAFVGDFLRNALAAYLI